jgi:hypothetical protein
MALQTTGEISFRNIKDEFDGTTPIQLSHYYRGGSLVPNTPENINIPTSGQIFLSNFYGASKAGAWTWLSGPDSVNEGSQATFSFSTTDNAFKNTTFTWQILGGATVADFVSISGSGTIDNSGIGSFFITAIADSLTEGPETYPVVVSAGGLQRLSRNLTVNDTSVTPANWQWTSKPLTMNEGVTSTFAFADLNATGVTGTFTWAILGASTADFNAVSGSGSIINNAGSFTITTKADSLTEGNEDFIVQVNRAGTQILAAFFTVIDTSTSPPSYAVTPAATNVSEGESLTFNITTANVTNGTVLHWRVENVAGTNSSDFVSMSGSVSVSNNGASFVVTTIAKTGNHTDKRFRTVISLTAGGAAVAISSTVTIQNVFFITFTPAELTGTGTVYGANFPVDVTVSVTPAYVEITGGSGSNYLPELDVTFWQRVTPDGGTFADLEITIVPNSQGGLLIGYFVYISRTINVPPNQTITAKDIGLRGKLTDQNSGLIAYSNQFSVETTHTAFSGEIP